jgi:hypothetical protein
MCPEWDALIQLDEYTPPPGQGPGPWPDPEPSWKTTFSKYERDNLLFLLNMIGYPYTEAVEPFNLLNNGDWLGQIVQKLKGPNGEIVIGPNDYCNAVSKSYLKESIQKWKERPTK